LLRAGAGLVLLPVAGGMAEVAEAASRMNGRALSLEHLHTGETLSIVYKVGRHFVPSALSRLQHLLRDFRTGEKHTMDPALYDLLWHIREDTRATRPFEIVSAFRSPRTNALLRRRSRQKGVAEHSLHLKGQAIDICVTGTPLQSLQQAALDLKAGGVGYYPQPGFLHIDTGRIRHW
jgi:uncharacterized protein YcbK (DUF882 family)